MHDNNITTDEDNYMSTLEISSELMKQVKSNKSVLAIFRKSLVTLYRQYRRGDSCFGEYQEEYSALLYKCSLMVE
jgi:hypothetical protein